VIEVAALPMTSFTGCSARPWRPRSSQGFHDDPGCLTGYGAVAALQPDTNFGRVLAAYGGVFIVGSLLWGSVWMSPASRRIAARS
jgi:hypothetical protein